LVLFRSQGNGQIFEQGVQPLVTTPGDFWYDTVNNIPYQNIAGTFTRIGAGQLSELGSTTLGGAANQIILTGMTGKKNLIILFDVKGFNLADVLLADFNGDASAVYDTFYAQYPAAANTVSNGNWYYLQGATSHTGRSQGMIVIRNESATNKILSHQGFVDTALQYVLSGGTWKNVAAQITTVRLFGQNGKNLLAGSTITVLGFDE